MLLFGQGVVVMGPRPSVLFDKMAKVGTREKRVEEVFGRGGKED